ncbi:MAG: response regulator [Alphaproteobacteria bacterium]
MDHDSEHTILIADDDVLFRRIGREVLEEVAIVIEAKNGQNAVDMYKEYSPALTFLDIHMPVKDGKEALREILEINPKAYVIMFSADAVKDNVLQTSHAGAKGFLAKPFSKDMLLSRALACPALKFRDQTRKSS